MEERTQDMRKSRGFALVAALTIMALLTMIGLALFSLSTVSIQTSKQALGLAEARENARMALSVAIGELQKQLGPDQRISAHGAITAASPDDTVTNPHWTGVWDSWVAGSPSEVEVNEDYPSEPSHHRTIGPIADNAEMHPDYANKDAHFRSWLLSLTPEEVIEIESANELSINGSLIPDGSSDAIQLVADGSLGPAADASAFVSARLLPIGGSGQDGSQRGRYAWWVGDESQKARIMGDSYITDADTSLAARLARQQAPGSMGTRAIPGMESLSQDASEEQKLAALPSMGTLSLIDGATPDAAFNLHDATLFSYGVLADVREGGLKRDLSTLLERPVDLSENSDDFMLYQFGNERVPIQDLAAYYQLYKGSIGDPDEGNRGVQYDSDLLPNGIQIPTPDYGSPSEPDKFLRQYTSMYRSPVPVKLQLLLGMSAGPRDPTEIDEEYPDTHELFLTTTLSITLWNPTNLPMVMDNRGRLFQRIRWNTLPLMLKWNKNGGEFEEPVPLGWLMGAANNHIGELDISRGEALLFEPGEVKVFSIPMDAIPGEGLIDFQRWDGDSRDYHNLTPDWDPFGFLTLSRSAAHNFLRSNGTIRYDSTFPPHIQNGRLLFSIDDQIQLEVTVDQPITEPISFFLSQDSHQDVGDFMWESTYHHYRHRSRRTPSDSVAASEFNQSLMEQGIPAGSDTITFPPRSGSAIIAASESGEASPFLQISLMAGVETHETASGGALGGRKFISRAFHHSSPIRAATIDTDTPDAFYNYGWNWWIEPINSILPFSVQVSEEGYGYYGGGYTPEAGSTHIVQQEIPVVPPMSIASLSHAHLGGTSLADSVPNRRWQNELDPLPLAVGKGGMFPHTVQAIGNAYAHPYLAPDQAYDLNFTREFVADEISDVVFADHSYLANKALWDDYFFSSITPQPQEVEAFGGSGRSAERVATDFFSGDEPLPNRRMTALDTEIEEIEALFDENELTIADRIAAHLMVEGPFNINSTSVEAWRALLASLKGKPVAYLDKDKALNGVTEPEEATTTGTPVAAFNMPNAQPGTGSSDPNDPEQWLGWRELNDTEIQELAEAIVRQVIRRGPFLSLSEFINRRLEGDSGDVDLAVKGALQAALDDNAVSINADFRDNFSREFSEAELTGLSPAFEEALEGPVAYGSAAYVDQADLLRNFAGQLTPRGDTFVIRAYGDALDAGDNVTARAWCEAIVQRVPEYVDSSADNPEVAARNLSPSNKKFGRKFEIVSFRWLSKDDI